MIKITNTSGEIGYTIWQETIGNGSSGITSSDGHNCYPPDGIVPLWKSEPVWSIGLWGTINMINFKSASGEIDTNDPDYGSFNMWIDPCYAGTVPGHGFLDGGKFWPKQPRTVDKSLPIPLGGSESIFIDLPKNTGIWGLGPRK